MSAYFVDSNVVMYAVGKEHPHKESCVSILRAIAQERIEAFTSVEVLQEIVYRFFMVGRTREGIEAAKRFMAFVEVLPVTEEDVEGAFVLARKYPVLPPRDSLHAAVMINNHLKEIISHDKHFDQIREVRRRDPSEVLGG